MKKLLLTTIFIFAIAAQAHAERVIRINNGISGLLMGAGGGAIAGQAIGRDTESTLIGTAVGTLFGYMVGNEMDKNQGQPLPVAYRPAPEPLYHERGYQERRYSYRPHPEPVEYRSIPEPVEYRRPPKKVCREVEILGTVGGKPQRILSTACKTRDGWVLVDPPGKPAAYKSKRNTYQPATDAYGRRIRYAY